MTGRNWFASDAAAGRVALVTGAASGIGRETALMLASLGADVAVVDMNRAGLDDVAAEIAAMGRRTAVAAFDLGDHDQIEPQVESLSAQLGLITILVNAAGMTGGPVMTESLELWNRVFAVNVTAPFLLTQSVGARMAMGGKGGNIVNVSSSSAFRAQAHTNSYGASKAALLSLTRNSAHALGEFNVNVNTVGPGVTRTNMTEPIFGGADGLKAAATEGPLSNMFHRVAEPDDVANAIVFLCLPASRQITGQVVQTSAGSVVSSG